jgi:hypothetical protein
MVENKIQLTFVRAEPKRKFNEKIQKPINRQNVKIVKAKKDK